MLCVLLAVVCCLCSALCWCAVHITPPQVTLALLVLRLAVFDDFVVVQVPILTWAFLQGIGATAALPAQTFCGFLL